MKARALAVVLAVALGLPARAAQTRTWTATATELQAGSADGVAVTSFGRVFLAPKLTRLGGDTAAAGAIQVWAAATDAHGNVFLGTGPEGRVLKLSPSGLSAVLFTCPEPIVTALALLPNGDLLAGTAPGGKIYRVRPDGHGELWCETGERYVWTLVVREDGAVLAGTGEQGIVFRIAPTGAADPLFDGPETHITALIAGPDGALIAGGSGRGALYRIERGGAAAVLFDSDLAEVADVALAADGSIIAALVGSPDVEPRPPALRIQLPQATQVGATPEGVAELDDRTAPTLEGVIEGLADTSETRSSRRPRGRIVRIATDGTVSDLWRSTSECPFSLALDPEGRIVFGTGEPARIRRIEGGGETALLATLQEAQTTVVVRSGSALVALTSNPAAAYRIDRPDSGAGTFVSRPFDAQGPARWGLLRWRSQGGEPGAFELEARSGNNAEPDPTWSTWGPAVTLAGGGASGVPDARFLQWRARLVGKSAAQGRISDVSVAYAPYNRPPEIDDFRLEGGSTAASSGAALRWTASDPDGDPVSVEISFRSAGSASWTTAFLSAPAQGGQAGDAADSWNDGKGTWNVAEVSEGEYEVRAVVSDEGANPPGEGGRVTAESPIFLVVDRTAPEVVARRRADGAVEVTAHDRASPIRRVEVIDGARVVFSPRAEDGVCDSLRETFRIDGAALEAPASDGSRRIRALDAAGNSSTVDIPAR